MKKKGYLKGFDPKPIQVVEVNNKIDISRGKKIPKNKASNEDVFDKHKLWLILTITVAVVLVGFLILFPVFKGGFAGKAITTGAGRTSGTGVSIVSTTQTAVASTTVETVSNVLVADYNFEGNANDALGVNNGNGVTISYLSDGVGQSVKLTGTENSYVTLPEGVLNNQNDFTVMMWVKSSDSDTGLLSAANTNQDNEFLLFIGSNNNLQVVMKGAKEEYSGLGVNDGQWHHLVITRTSSDIKLYFDGELKVPLTEINFNSDALNVQSLVLGQEQDKRNVGGSSTQKLLKTVGSTEFTIDSGQAFDGQIDEMRFYSYVVDEETIGGTYDTEFAGLNAGFTFATTMEPSAVLTTPLVANYNFESNANDALGVNNGNGVGVSYLSDGVGQSVKLTGTENSYVTIPEGVLNNQNDFTVMMWVKGSGTSGAGIISAASTEIDNELLIYKLSDLAFYLKGEAKKPSTTLNLADGMWHHLVITRSGNTINVYADSINKGTLIYTAAGDALNVQSLVLGQEQDKRNVGGSSTQKLLKTVGSTEFTIDSNQAFDGQIDEVRFYNYVVSQNEIETIFETDNPTYSDIIPATEMQPLAGTYAVNFLSAGLVEIDGQTYFSEAQKDAEIVAATAGMISIAEKDTAIATATSQLQQEKTVLTTQVNTLSNNIYSLTQERDEYKNQANTLSVSIQSLTTEKAALQGQLTTAITEKNAAVTEKNVAVAAKTQLEQEKTILLNDKASLQTQLSTAVTEKNVAVAAKTQLEGEKTSLLNDKASLQTQLSAAVTEKNVAVIAKNQLEDDKASLTQENDEFKLQVDNLQSSVQSKDNTIITLRNDLTQAENVRDDYNNQLEEEKNKAKQAEDRAKRAESLNSVLKSGDFDDDGQFTMDDLLALWYMLKPKIGS